jgi:hypothetical protein
MSPDWKLLAGLPADELQSALLAEVDAVMEGQPCREEDRLLLALPEPLRAMWLVNWLDFEVSQGSLLAYFYNSHGRHATQAIDLLRRLGANHMAAVLAQAASSYEQASAEWAARRAENDAAGEFAVVKPYKGLSNAADLGRLTDEYWEAADDDDWGSKLDAYLSEQVRLLAV